MIELCGECVRLIGVLSTMRERLKMRVIVRIKMLKSEGLVSSKLVGILELYSTPAARESA